MAIAVFHGHLKSVEVLLNNEADPLWSLREQDERSTRSQGVIPSAYDIGILRLSAARLDQSNSSGSKSSI